MPRPVEFCECSRQISSEGLFGDDNVRGREVFFEDIATFIVCQPRLQANVTAQASGASLQRLPVSLGDLNGRDRATCGDHDIHQSFRWRGGGRLRGPCFVSDHVGWFPRTIDVLSSNPPWGPGRRRINFLFPVPSVVLLCPRLSGSGRQGLRRVPTWQECLLGRLSAFQRLHDGDQFIACCFIRQGFRCWSVFSAMCSSVGWLFGEKVGRVIRLPVLRYLLLAEPTTWATKRPEARMPSTRVH